MTHKIKKLASISILATAVFLWDLGIYLLFNEFVAKLFLVIILISGAWTYYELKRATEMPSDYNTDVDPKKDKINDTEGELENFDNKPTDDIHTSSSGYYVKRIIDSIDDFEPSEAETTKLEGAEFRESLLGDRSDLLRLISIINRKNKEV